MNVLGTNRANGNMGARLNYKASEEGRSKQLTARKDLAFIRRLREQRHVGQGDNSVARNRVLSLNGSQV